MQRRIEFKRHERMARELRDRLQADPRTDLLDQASSSSIQAPLSHSIPSGPARTRRGIRRLRSDEDPRTATPSEADEVDDVTGNAPESASDDCSSR